MIVIAERQRTHTDTPAASTVPAYERGSKGETARGEKMNGAAHPQARHPHHHQHHQHPPPPQQTASAAGAAPSSGTMIPPRMNGQHQGPMRIIPGPNAAMQPFPIGRSPPNLDTSTVPRRRMIS